ncbi:hypothetical protein AVEN_267241-1 [Araneus ventricosus]|uniref:Uncharacterized protein n=1 Tax=Araneus ventricosus TaxID=182803 RepID=A0A4Y2SS31_ARAVE|nr:hypothetical protein AVEN_123234-1 [Araneus ventricosus]GBN91178.1 hypothetical protein AVEN_267241-1 [Araneus ventricosus]
MERGFGSGLVDCALFLCRKFAAKLPPQVCHDKLISRKINLSASVHAIWVADQDHEGKPYCNTPCYGALFGPGGFGRGGTESHTYKK